MSNRRAVGFCTHGSERPAFRIVAYPCFRYSMAKEMEVDRIYRQSPSNHVGPPSGIEMGAALLRGCRKRCRGSRPERRLRLRHEDASFLADVRLVRSSRSTPLGLPDVPRSVRNPGFHEVLRILRMLFVSIVQSTNREGSRMVRLSYTAWISSIKGDVSKSIRRRLLFIP